MSDWICSVEQMIRSDGANVGIRTVPVKELVRCAECKHLFDGEHTENCCDVLMEKAGWLKEISVSTDWFCADGEHKEGGEVGCMKVR